MYEESDVLISILWKATTTTIWCIIRWAFRNQQIEIGLKMFFSAVLGREKSLLVHSVSLLMEGSFCSLQTKEFLSAISNSSLYLFQFLLWHLNGKCMSLNGIWDILYIFFMGIKFHELKVLGTFVTEIIKNDGKVIRIGIVWIKCKGNHIFRKSILTWFNKCDPSVFNWHCPFCRFISELVC